MNQQNTDPNTFDLNGQSDQEFDDLRVQWIRDNSHRLPDKDGHIQFLLSQLEKEKNKN